MRLWQVRVQIDRSQAVLDGLVNLSIPVKDHAQCRDKERVIGFQLNGSFGPFDGSLGIASPGQKTSELGHDRGLGRLQPQRPLIGLDSIPDLTIPVQPVPFLNIGDSIAGRCRSRIEGTGPLWPFRK